MTSSALQSRKWQLIGMSQWCRSALCGHPLPVLTDNWTHGAASRHTKAPISHTRPSPLLISRPADGRRLSWPEHIVGQQLAQSCLQWTGCESNPQPRGYESDTLQLHHCTHPVQVYLPPQIQDGDMKIRNDAVLLLTIRYLTCEHKKRSYRWQTARRCFVKVL